MIFFTRAAFPWLYCTDGLGDLDRSTAPEQLCLHLLYKQFVFTKERNKIRIHETLVPSPYAFLEV